MKKVKFVLLIIMMFCFTCLASCNKSSDFNNQDYGRIKYYYSGLYIQVNEYDDFSLSDPNPKIYFDFTSSKDFGRLVTKSGSLNAAVTYTNLAKTIKEEDGVNKYYMTAKLRFINSDLTKIKLYLITIDNDNNFVVKDDVTESININNTSSYDFLIEFTKSKIKYQLQMKLLFK